MIVSKVQMKSLFLGVVRLDGLGVPGIGIKDG
jgi:hypothetical protein